MHRPLFLLTAGSVAAVGGLLVASALPAGAATSSRTDAALSCTATANGTTPETYGPCSTDTPVTFTVTTTGTLSIDAPDGIVDLGGGVIGGSDVSGLLGPVTVTDTRALDPATWVATVSSTDFTNGTNSADTIPARYATYTPGTISGTNTSGTATETTAALTLANGTTTGISPSTVTVGAPIVTQTGTDGDNTAVWDPTISVHLPTNAVIGTYAGTITHSVS